MCKPPHSFSVVLWVIIRPSNWFDGGVGGESPQGRLCFRPIQHMQTNVTNCYIFNSELTEEILWFDDFVLVLMNNTEYVLQIPRGEMERKVFKKDDKTNPAVRQKEKKWCYSMLQLWNTSWHNLKTHRSVEKNSLARSGTVILQGWCNKEGGSLRPCIHQTWWNRKKKSVQC